MPPRPPGHSTADTRAAGRRTFSLRGWAAVHEDAAGSTPGWDSCNPIELGRRPAFGAYRTDARAGEHGKGCATRPSAIARGAPGRDPSPSP